MKKEACLQAWDDHSDNPFGRVSLEIVETVALPEWAAATKT